MAFLNYKYTMTIDYSEPVAKCYFTLKSIPADDFRQRSISYEISMTSDTTYSESKDSFGNNQIIGSVIEPHTKYEYTIKGLVETNVAGITGGVNESKVGMYKYPHGKCIPGEKIKEFAKKINEEIAVCTSDKEKCIKIMQRLYENLVYEKGNTEIDTTAEEAFAGGKGVCQDYAHILLSLLRLDHIPARYVVGMMSGEGASHAWVEVEEDGIWYGIDPTNGKFVDDNYIFISCGRDAYDCQMNRGMLSGGGLQSQSVTVIVREQV